MTRPQHEVRLSGPFCRARDPSHRSSWLNVRHDLDVSAVATLRAGGRLAETRAWLTRSAAEDA